MRTYQTIDLAFGLVIVGVVTWTVSQSSSWLWSGLFGLELPRGWGTRAGLFPTVIGLPVLVLAVVQAGAALRRLREGTPGPAMDADPLADEGPARRLVAIGVAIVGFAAGVWLLGFLVAIPLTTVAYLRLAGGESWRVSVGMAAGAALVFYVVFIALLNVKLPEGLLLTTLFG